MTATVELRRFELPSEGPAVIALVADTHSKPHPRVAEHLAAEPPTLILHGQADTRVPVGQAQELYMGLKKNDVPVELVFFPREPHGLLEPRHQADKLARELAFFAKHVLGRKTLQ